MPNNQGKKKFKFSLRMPRQYNVAVQISLLVLCLFGTVMILSVSSQDAAMDPLGSFKTLFRQMVFFVGGYIGMVILARNFTLSFAKKYSFLGMVVGILLLIFTFFFPNSYGIRAWISIPLPSPLPNFTIQPSEFMKLMIIIFLAVYWGNCSPKMNYQFRDVFQMPILMVGIAALIVLRQPDFGSFAIIGFLVGILSLLPTHKVFRHFQRTMQIIIVVVVVFAFFLMSPLGIGIVKHIPFIDGYQIQRFELALNPFISNINEGYQLVNGLVAFFTGGLTGVGLGNSTHKYGYVPAAKTDSILPIIVEETGMIGFGIIVVMYSILIYQIFRYAFKINNIPAKMILIGIASYFFIHFVLNVGGVSGLIPMTGIPLVFISLGGSSTLTGMLAIGVVQALISSYKRGEIM